MSTVPCKRFIRVCDKIKGILENDIDGDMEESLDNIQKGFLIVCESFHTDIDTLECEDKNENGGLYDEAHANIEIMCAQLTRLIYRMKSSLAYGTRDWLHDFEDEMPSLISEMSCRKESCPQSMEEPSTFYPLQETIGSFCKDLGESCENTQEQGSSIDA